jgi:hypothetical protein
MQNIDLIFVVVFLMVVFTFFVDSFHCICFIDTLQTLTLAYFLTFLFSIFSFQLNALLGSVDLLLNLLKASPKILLLFKHCRP